jgi:hypothetical protein
VIVASGEGVLADEATEGFFPGDDLFAALRPRGLPIGNLTSHFFRQRLAGSDRPFHQGGVARTRVRALRQRLSVFR